MTNYGLFYGWLYDLLADYITCPRGLNFSQPGMPARSQA